MEEAALQRPRATEQVTRGGDNASQAGQKKAALKLGRGGGRGSCAQALGVVLVQQWEGDSHLEGDEVLPGEGLIRQQVSEVLGLDV